MVQTTPDMDRLYKEMVGYNPFEAEFLMRNQKFVSFVSQHCLQEGEVLMKKIEECGTLPPNQQRACVEQTSLPDAFESCYKVHGKNFHLQVGEKFNSDEFQTAEFCAASIAIPEEEAPQHQRCIASRVLFWETNFPTSQYGVNGATKIVDAKAKRDVLNEGKVMRQVMGKKFAQQ
eukprot:CAMPEP_0201526580 /NCGR_PEP_ID=MMETSP0161_2-20130828/32228_1 /ASSEMBLY_ACC=CAM_ASM_000251 /TAXON_ID=180227 /ORGANISM="Neoparamoeba aestuarina, Strain SoJaBio B1-5/56/2" /LENGTH=174 /DNA_ID=CAMNT_0047927027 /DNA_START=109 /DNA_END=633 /DNA_ORIENTATION=-